MKEKEKIYVIPSFTNENDENPISGRCFRDTKEGHIDLYEFLADNYGRHVAFGKMMHELITMCFDEDTRADCIYDNVACEVLILPLVG